MWVTLYIDLYIFDYVYSLKQMKIQPWIMNMNMNMNMNIPDCRITTQHYQLTAKSLLRILSNYYEDEELINMKLAEKFCSAFKVKLFAFFHEQFDKTSLKCFTDIINIEK